MQSMLWMGKWLVALSHNLLLWLTPPFYYTQAEGRVLHRNMKWTIHIFWSMVCYSIANALTLYNIHEWPSAPMTMQQAIKGVVMGIFNAATKVPISMATKSCKSLHEWFINAQRHAEVQEAADDSGFLPLPFPHLTHTSYVGDKKQCAQCKKLPLSDPRRTSKTTHYCSICNVPLHKRRAAGETSSCWEIFHGIDDNR